MAAIDRIKTMPSAEYLRDCLDYDPENGMLHWKTRPLAHFPNEPIWKMWNRQNAGKATGFADPRGYHRLHVDGHYYKAHRIIFKWMTGQEPPLPVVDHIDGNKSNNRWSNLRPASYAGSTWNAGLHRDSGSGVRGISFKRGKWQTQITINGRSRYLGTFASAEEAAAAYETAARKARGLFYRPPPPT